MTINPKDLKKNNDILKPQWLSKSPQIGHLVSIAEVWVLYLAAAANIQLVIPTTLKKRIEIFIKENFSIKRNQRSALFKDLSNFGPNHANFITGLLYTTCKGSFESHHSEGLLLSHIQNLNIRTESRNRDYSDTGLHESKKGFVDITGRDSYFWMNGYLRCCQSLAKISHFIET